MDGNLEGQALADFKAWLATDKELQAALRLRQTVKTFYKHQADLAYLEQVKTVMQQAPPPPESFVIRQSWWRSIVGVVLVIGIGITAWWQLGDQNALAEQLKQVVIEEIGIVPYENIYNQLPETDKRAAAMQAYEAKDYSLAIERMEDYRKFDPRDKQFQLYLGVSYLLRQPSQTTLAIDMLNPLHQLEAPDALQEVANWYLAMAYCLAEAPDKAKPILEQISVSAYSYRQEEAEEILNRIIMIQNRE